MENTYVFYISNYRDGNSVATAEQRLYSVPISEADSAYALTDPVIKTQMSKAGSFEFSITPQHSYYDKWLQMKTIMRVKYAGETIFRGRVLTIDNSPMNNGLKKIHLEGDFAFFLDSVQEGIKDDDRTEKTLEAYLAELINNHNSQMAGEDYKKIYLGNAPGNYDTYGTPSQMRVKGDTRKYGESSWRTTSDALSSLQSQFGGYFRTRYNENDGKCYLDWLDKYFDSTVGTQHIEITENLIDLSSVTEVENLFTVLVPVGSKEGKNVYLSDNKKYVTVPEVAQWYRDEGREGELNDIYHTSAEYFNAIANYGTIYRTQSFPNADTPEKLQEYAYDWVKNNFVGGIDSFTVTALDIRHIDAEEQAFFCGHLVPVVYPNASYAISGGSPTVEKTLALTSIQYNPHNPAQNSYEIGIPNSEIKNKTYGTSNTKNSTGGGGGGASGITASAGGGGGYTQNQTDILREEASQRAWDYIVSKTYNNDEWQRIEQEEPQHAKAILKGTHLILTEEQLVDPDHPQSTFTKRLRAAILDGPKKKIEMYPNAAIPLKELTDEQIERYERWGTTLLIDGENSLLSLGAKMDVRGYNDPIFAQKNRQLAQLKADASNASLRLWPRNKVDPSIVDPDSVPTSVEMDSGSDKSNGSLGIGRDSSNNYHVTGNKSISWQAPDGTWKTIEHGMHAADYHLNDIGSVSAKFLAVDQLVATKATIEQLNAVNATIGTLDTEIANVRELAASKATIGELETRLASSSTTIVNNLQADYAAISRCKIGSHVASWGAIGGFPVLTHT